MTRGDVLMVEWWADAAERASFFRNTLTFERHLADLQGG